MLSETVKLIKVFYCYAPEDKIFVKKLDVHLSGLKRQDKLLTWHNEELSPGTEREQVILRHLETSQIILLMISPHFLASNYCCSIEMTQAIDWHEKGIARVIPIIVRPVDWEQEAFSKLQVLPISGKPITRWQE